ncbi:MAG: hypothetical protein EXX96DRAFT_517890 [Benjaminiella poitrasii]|nr:MAG: hypothetical protein EXX96DRAFT_517890 [Benjaminiella poitrasii]
MPNTTKPENFDIPPAQMVGGMRVKQPDPHRTHLKEKREESSKMMEEQERLRQRELQERQARDMQNHTASRQAFTTGNPGTHITQKINPATQPRSLNH